MFIEETASGAYLVSANSYKKESIAVRGAA